MSSKNFYCSCIFFHVLLVERVKKNRFIFHTMNSFGSSHFDCAASRGTYLLKLYHFYSNKSSFYCCLNRPIYRSDMLQMWQQNLGISDFTVILIFSFYNLRFPSVQLLIYVQKKIGKVLLPSQELLLCMIIIIVIIFAN